MVRVVRREESEEDEQDKKLDSALVWFSAATFLYIATRWSVRLFPLYFSIYPCVYTTPMYSTSMPFNDPSAISSYAAYALSWPN